MPTEESTTEAALTVEQLLYAVIAVMAAAIVMLAATLILRKMGKTVPKAVNVASYVIFGICATGTVAFAIVCGIAKSHGMYTLDMAAERLLPAIQRSPTDQSEQYAKSISYKPGQLVNPDTKSGLVVMYRFSCPDCEYINADMQVKLKASNLPYWWVSSRSEVGRALCERYGIDQVPAIIAFDGNGKMSIGQLHTTKDGHVVVDEQAWKIALDHASQTSES